MPQVAPKTGNSFSVEIWPRSLKLKIARRAGGVLSTFEDYAAKFFLARKLD
jgi:hypothetical protein